MIPLINTLFQLAYVNLGEQAENDCDSIEIMVSDGKHKITAEMEGMLLFSVVIQNGTENRLARS